MFGCGSLQHVCFYKESPVGLGNPSGLSCVYPRICDNRMTGGYYHAINAELPEWGDEMSVFGIMNYFLHR